MENNIYLDYQKVTDFLKKSEEELLTDIAAITPDLNKSNLSLIKKYYEKSADCPTYGELKIFERLLRKQREHADGILISKLGCDSIALMETHSDLMSKAETIYGKKPHGLTLDEAANVSSAYMRMIGRYDSMPTASSKQQKSSENTLVFHNENTPLLYFGKEQKDNTPSFRRTCDTYAVILIDPDDGSRDYIGLFGDKKVRSLTAIRARIGDFGIIGTLADLCEGIKADTARLSDELSEAEALCDAYRGKYLVMTDVKKASLFCRLAESLGYRGIHFANTNPSGQLRTRVSSIPLSILRELMGSRRIRPAYVTDCRPSETCAPLSLTAIKNGKSYDVNNGRLIKSNNRIISASCLAPTSNSFGSAVNTLTDSILRLVCAGVDRRAICSAVSYEFLKNDVDPENIGEEFSLILGIYRVCVELAISEGYTNVTYGNTRRASTALYATAPRVPISAHFARMGSNICFLPLGTGSDGLVDFASLRRITDTFIGLYKSGKVISARPVTSSIAQTLDTMRTDLCASLSENGKAIASIPCRGILFETADKDPTDVIGNVIEIAKNIDTKDQNNAIC